MAEDGSGGGRGGKDIAEKYTFIYGREDEKKVEYEVCELPMQNKVATVRRIVSKNWNYLQVYSLILGMCSFSTVMASELENNKT